MDIPAVGIEMSVHSMSKQKMHPLSKHKKTKMKKNKNKNKEGSLQINVSSDQSKVDGASETNNPLESETTLKTHIRHVTEKGVPYYEDVETGEVTWTKQQTIK